MSEIYVNEVVDLKCPNNIMSVEDYWERGNKELDRIKEENPSLYETIIADARKHAIEKVLEGR